MILHRLIRHHVKHRDDAVFYQMQASDAIRWIKENGVPLRPGLKALDLGCGHGVFGAELAKEGCDISYADFQNSLLPELKGAKFQTMNLDAEDLVKLGEYDLVICSNVLEHLAKPNLFLSNAQKLLRPEGVLFLSWTNWLSPWGGHEFSPFHYLGPHYGHVLYDKLVKRPRLHTPFVSLFPTYIGQTLQTIRQNRELRLLAAAPRYFTNFSFLIHIPIVREFLVWNCSLLIGRNK